MAPLPIIVVTTGILVIFTNSSSSLLAPEILTPSPIKNNAKSYEKLVNNEEFQIRESTTKEKERTFIEESISIELIREILGEKLKSGKLNEIKELLKKYNAEKLSSVKEEDYKALF